MSKFKAAGGLEVPLDPVMAYPVHVNIGIMHSITKFKIGRMDDGQLALVEDDKIMEREHVKALNINLGETVWVALSGTPEQAEDGAFMSTTHTYRTVVVKMLDGCPLLLAR